MATREYYRLRRIVTRQADTLFRRYANQVKCAKGCYFCCDRITVLPIELEAVRRWRATDAAGGATPGGTERPSAPAAVEIRDRTPEGVQPAPNSKGERCGFLGAHGECTIYSARPLICRTHGLPLAYRVYEYDQQGQEIMKKSPEYLDMWCDLNFADIPDERASGYFDGNGRINMDRINAQLEELNAGFLASPAGGRYAGCEPGERIPLDSLVSRSCP